MGCTLTRFSAPPPPSSDTTRQQSKKKKKKKNKTSKRKPMRSNADIAAQNLKAMEANKKRGKTALGHDKGLDGNKNSFDILGPSKQHDWVGFSGAAGGGTF